MRTAPTALAAAAAVLAAAPLALGAATPGVPARGSVAARPDASPGRLVVGLQLPDPGFQVGAVAGDRITYVAGFEADLARALAARLHLGRLSFVQSNLDAVGAAGPKKWEIALGRLAPQSAGPVAYTGAYLRAGPVVLARKRLARPAGLADLAKAQLCTTAGSRGRTVIATRIHPVAAPLVADDDDRLVGWIRTGRCDAAVREAPELATALDGRLASVGRIVGIVDNGRSYAVAVPRTTGLQPRVDRALTALRAAGTVHALAVKWLGFDPNRLRALR